jgi:hypothetical protein
MDLSQVGAVNFDAFKVIMPAVYLRKADAELKIALPDAKDTCMLCGALNALIGGLLPLLEDHICLKKLRIAVTPQFKNEKFSAYFNGIFKIDLVHIIIRYFKYKKEKAVLKNASNREHYASNHE